MRVINFKKQNNERIKSTDYYNEMKEIVDVPYFTKLTSTGISPDYESIFDFAEAYYDA